MDARLVSPGRGPAAAARRLLDATSAAFRSGDSGPLRVTMFVVHSKGCAGSTVEILGAMDLRSQDAVDGAVVRAVRGLFEAYGHPVTSVAPPRTTNSPRECRDMAGVIGFCSEQMNGTVVVSTVEDVVLETVPAGVAQPKSRDWLGELSNQLMGRLKNQLGEFGVTLHVSTPVVLTGTRLCVFGSALAGVRVYGFTSTAANEAPVTVFVEWRLQDGLKLERIEQDSGNAQEGSELFF